MKKRKQLVLLVGILMILCVSLLVSCKNQMVYFNDYTDEDLNFVGKIVQAMHGWIGNYGWTVVVFTLFLKIVMLPLDMWQRISTRKSAVKMQKMQPVMESIDKRYGANTQRANEEKQKLYKKQGYSMMSSCLPMIVTMVIFFVMFGGLTNYATYNSVHNFKNLYNQYYTEYFDEGVAKTDEFKLLYEQKLAEYGQQDISAEQAETKAKEDALRAYQAGKDFGGADIGTAQKNLELRAAALDTIPDYYEANHESWLWIKNVWQPDTWDTIMQDYDKFTQSVSLKGLENDDGREIYTQIRAKVLSTHTERAGADGAWNGLMILPILSVGLSFLSIWISQRMDRKNRKGEVPKQDQQQAATNKMMMILMPLMMAFFGFMYTGAFAIYMVTNYSLSIIATVALRVPVEKMVERSIAKAEEKNNAPKASYKR